MKNVNLNVGGAIGAILAIGLLLAFIYSGDGEAPRKFGKAMMLAGVVGGGAGNYLWGLVFRKPGP